MTNHLSSDQISSLLAGEASPEEQQHASDCVECAAALARLRETLSMFRDSVQHWTDRNGGRVLPEPVFLRNEPRALRLHPFRWALAAAALIILVAVPFYKNVSERRHEAETFEDTLLLEQVNAHLSRDVSAPMEPLMELLSNPSAEGVGGRQ